MTTNLYIYSEYLCGDVVEVHGCSLLYVWRSCIDDGDEANDVEWHDDATGATLPHSNLQRSSSLRWTSPRARQAE